MSTSMFMITAVGSSNDFPSRKCTCDALLNFDSVHLECIHTDDNMISFLRIPLICMKTLSENTYVYINVLGMPNKLHNITFYILRRMQIKPYMHGMTYIHINIIICYVK